VHVSSRREQAQNLCVRTQSYFRNRIDSKPRCQSRIALVTAVSCWIGLFQVKTHDRGTLGLMCWLLDHDLIKESH